MHIIYDIIGFITFKTRRAQVTAAQIPILSQKYPTVTAISAPARSDIIWDNMSISTIHTENAAYLTAIFYYTGKLYGFYSYYCGFNDGFLYASMVFYTVLWVLFIFSLIYYGFNCIYLNIVYCIYRVVVLVVSTSICCSIVRSVYTREIYNYPARSEHYRSGYTRRHPTGVNNDVI